MSSDMKKSIESHRVELTKLAQLHRQKAGALQAKGKSILANREFAAARAVEAKIEMLS